MMKRVERVCEMTDDLGSEATGAQPTHGEALTRRPPTGRNGRLAFLRNIVFPPDAPDESTNLGSGVTGAQPADGSTVATRRPPSGSNGHSAGIAEAVKYANEARDSHIQWAWHLENYGCSRSGAEVEIAGSLEEHHEWIRRYDVILHALGESA